MAFKHACQLIATDTHQINANLATALAVIARASTECEQAASPEEAQIGAIAALQTLADLVSSSRRASEEKITSLHEVFARLSRQEGQAVVVPLPSVQEDEGRVRDDPDAGESVHTNVSLVGLARDSWLIMSPCRLCPKHLPPPKKSMLNLCNRRQTLMKRPPGSNLRKSLKSRLHLSRRPNRQHRTRSTKLPRPCHLPHPKP